MLQTVASTIAAHSMLENCNHVIVGVSGGADSVCLLSVLSAYVLKNQLPIQLHVAHVNHGLRGEAADHDEAVVTNLCKQWDIPLYRKCCNVADLAKEEGISVEMAGRTVRYAFFKEIADTLPNCKIAVAHNRDDRAETVLWNIIRGTGLDGLKGISYVRDNVIRPLLDVSKEDIRAYCKEQKLPVCQDASNEETIYSRNKIRLELMPFIEEKFQTDMTEKILRLSDNVSADEAFLQEKTKEAISVCLNTDGTLEVKKLLQQSKAIQIRMLQEFCGHQLEQVHLQALLTLIEQGKTGKQLSLPGGLEAVIQYGMLRIQKSEKRETLFFSHEATDTFVWEPTKQTVCCEVLPVMMKMPLFSNKSTEQVFDYDKLLQQCERQKTTLCVRNRQEGDFIRPWKGTGRKAIKKFFIDQKIERTERDALPLLAIGSEILWIAGHRRCDDYFPTGQTKRYFKISVKNV